MDLIKRVFVEKNNQNNLEAMNLLDDLRINLGIQSMENLRILNCYDISGIDREAFEFAKNVILSEPPVDLIYLEDFPKNKNDICFSVAYLPGQYDQRADSAVQCFQIITKGITPIVNFSKFIVLTGKLTNTEIERIKNYCINPVDSEEKSLDKPETLLQIFPQPDDIEILNGFISFSDDEIKALRIDKGYAMSTEDLIFCRNYFRDEEKRDPSITEIRVIDTYWSDHCRHTTFLTKLDSIEIEDGYYKELFEKVLLDYMEQRTELYQGKDKPVCLMDLAIIGAKSIKKQGLLNDLDESEEVNACSIEIDVDVNGQMEKWLLMFKNETHNHPTEIEPFGGAATCLGGAIRDPLSGRAYVYQAMRVTGSANPLTPVDQTLPGKLPQRKITTEAAHGYSSYGNQIGLATGHVREIYHEGFVAKRMEVGAVIAAAPKENVIRERPQNGDVVILVGGRTGRDGCGGATGSSKEHTEDSLALCGAEVQKGNPPTERKLQRLFRNKEAALLIKRCNDFGAGGVSVAIGEIADSVYVDLDKIPKKYEGLDGTELAISESQERMAVVVNKNDAQKFIDLADSENVEATIIGHVSDDNCFRMVWRGKEIVNLKRSFLNTNGVMQNAKAFITAPEQTEFFNETVIPKYLIVNNLPGATKKLLSDLNICSQKGLVEMFDATIGAGTVLMPFGGKHQLTPEDVCAAKIPVLSGETKTASLMSFGYQPDLFDISPFHGGVYAVVESVAKIVAAGGDFSKIRLSCQEYFEKMTENPVSWGKPTSALLGALHSQLCLKVPSIGGKDSMSGTFKDINVPPVLISFAVCSQNSDKIISSAMQKQDSYVYLLKPKYDKFNMPDFNSLTNGYTRILRGIESGEILSAKAIPKGGIMQAIVNMCAGNKVGADFVGNLDVTELFIPYYGGILVEATKEADFEQDMFIRVFKTTNTNTIQINDTAMTLDDLIEVWSKPLESVFPSMAQDGMISQKPLPTFDKVIVKKSKVAKPKIFMPVFPGTNCEYDTSRKFTEAGGEVDVFVFRNNTKEALNESLKEMARKIDESNIISLIGGFSAGDEPDGSGKFIASIFRNPYIKEATEKLLSSRDGLILGICNGFQALVKLGLLPYGEITDMTKDSPTLTFNNIGRLVSTISKTKIVSCKTPFLWNVNPDEIYNMAISHGEGKFICNEEILNNLAQNGQIATVYVDLDGNPSAKTPYNPNGSYFAIEGITSPDGRVFGKMGHSERIGTNVYKNIPGLYDQKIFESGIKYYE